MDGVTGYCEIKKEGRKNNRKIKLKKFELSLI